MTPASPTTLELPAPAPVRCSDLLCRLGVTPYYKNQWCAVIKGDCREILPAMPDEFGLLVTDPPYGVNFQSNMRQDSWGEIVGDDGKLDVNECLSLAISKLMAFRHLYVFGPCETDKLKVGTPAKLIWDKCVMTPGNLNIPWGSQHEEIIFAVKVESEKHKDRGFGNLSARLRRGSVIRCQRTMTANHHPTEKPVELLRQLIESSSVMYESVLDPFCGSGSTLVAAQIESRYAVGIEYEERHCETAAKRLEQLGAW